MVLWRYIVQELKHNYIFKHLCHIYIYILDPFLTEREEIRPSIFMVTHKAYPHLCACVGPQIEVLQQPVALLKGFKMP